MVAKKNIFLFFLNLARFAPLREVSFLRNQGLIVPNALRLPLCALLLRSVLSPLWQTKFTPASRYLCHIFPGGFVNRRKGFEFELETCIDASGIGYIVIDIHHGISSAPWLCNLL